MNNLNTQPSELPQDELSLFTFAVFRMNGLMLRNGNRITAAVGQSSARWQVLGRIGFMPQTVAGIARDMGHARQSVQRIADVLQQEGFIRHVENPGDKRTQLLKITSKGETVLTKLYELNDEWTRQIMAKLNADELRQMTDTLHKISNIIECEEDLADAKDKI